MCCSVPGTCEHANHTALACFSARAPCHEGSNLRWSARSHRRLKTKGRHSETVGTRSTRITDLLNVQLLNCSLLWSLPRSVLHGHVHQYTSHQCLRLMQPGVFLQTEQSRTELSAIVCQRNHQSMIRLGCCIPPNPSEHLLQVPDVSARMSLTDVHPSGWNSAVT